MADKIPSLSLIVIFCIVSVYSLPEQGVWDVNITSDQTLPFQKSMYNQTQIAVQIHCNSDDPDLKVMVSWLLRWTPCAEEYLKVYVDREVRDLFYNIPANDNYGLKYKSVDYQLSTVPIEVKCDGEPTSMPDESDKNPRLNVPVRSFAGNDSVNAQVSNAGSPAKAGTKRLRRDTQVKANGTKPVKTTMQAGQGNDPHVVVTTWRDGIYLFLMKFETPEESKSTYSIEVNVKMKGPHGYLSAIEWPLMPFYGSMCVVYIIYGIAWLILSACNWRDLLRIQFWIGGVIFLGMLEKAVFFGEYSSINLTGRSVRGAVVFAEVVSCLKRTVARMLVVIVSLGFGIVKPRLGPMLHRVLGMGFLYFILGSVEACLRALRAKSDVSNQALLANIPLAVLDAAICWWVFTSLVQTTRTLRLRRNLVKLSLYRHFTNTLIFAVLASVAFMIWSIKQHRLTTCLTDWKEIWVDDAFWHLLFSVILLVIMILWRPNINNQRYAFSPLVDAAEDDEAEEPMMNDAFEGMKMRTNSNSRSGSPKPKENKAEDDLKWIEENIPTSVTDTALPSLLDSDEEIMTTKFEMSKME